jgi:hypothetical protein
VGHVNFNSSTIVQLTQPLFICIHSIHHLSISHSACDACSCSAHPPRCSYSAAHPASSMLTGATNARRSAGPWRGSPPASPPAMTLAPRCRWQRRPHRDTMHVASVHFKCFRGMLQVFHTDVAKVDWDVAYVTMVVHVCCKRLSPIFHLFFQIYVANVFLCMLHMFHTYVTSVLSGCCIRHMLHERSPQRGPSCGRAKSRCGQGHAGTGAECRRARKQIVLSYSTILRYPTRRPGATRSVS